MPMPKLLKKLSRKSLRGHDSEHETEPELPPSLPVSEHNFGEDSSTVFSSPLSFPPSPKSSPRASPRPSGDWSREMIRSASTGNVPTNPNATNGGFVQKFTTHSAQPSQSSFTQKPPSRQPSYAPPSGSPPPQRSRTSSYGSSRTGYFAIEGDPRSHPGSVFTPSQLGYQPPTGPFPVDYHQDELSRNLAGAWDIANTAPKASKTDNVLQAIEGNIIKAQLNETNAAAVVTGITAGLEAVGGMEAIEHGLNTFMEGIPVLMNALDEVAKLHPFIGVAVMAFKAVWALEQKRRANDKMILSLHMEMKDMMGVLTQLKSVKDSEEVAPDGSTIRGRMQEIVKGSAEDIKSCANTCDTYCKKKTIVKVLNGFAWEGKLVKFVGIFTKRRSEFEFALSIHTALGVDAANRALSVVDKTTQDMNAKMDMMMKMFQQFVTPEQREMARLVELKGGVQACQDNDKILKELSDLENISSAASQASSGSQTAKGGTNRGKTSGLEDLKDEIMTDPDVAIEKNSTAFARKFEVQKRQIVDELTKVVERQGDRVISAITAGPHDKIIDPDVHKIWKEMAWRGSVKSRYFVMALRDYYQEGAERKDAAAGEKRADDWALVYLSVSRLQSISETFDDDVSGFVTVAEANTFTTSRPLDWTLPHWLAFWAIGWHQSMARYAAKIRELIAKMFALRSRVLPANRTSVNGYLDSIYHGVTTLCAGLNPCYINEGLQEKFNSYVEAEEARLRGNLEAISYDIDALNTLYLITGQGRIERFLLPLIYLLLERDFQIFRTCQKQVIHPDELWDAADTVGYTVVAAQERLDLLESNFKQQKVDMLQQFKIFAHGLFQYIHDPSGLWDPKIVLAQDDAEYPYDDSLEAQDVDLTKILNYPLGMEKLDFDAYAVVAKPKKVATRPSPALKALLGIWHGFTYSPASSVVPSSGMISMDLTSNGGTKFAASSRSNMSDFTISGECGQSTDFVNFTFKQSFPARFPPLYFAGSCNGATKTLSGTWGEESDSRTHNGVFTFKRLNPECMCFFPAPAALQANKPRALWSFAIAAVQYGVRREAWSWSLFKQRSENRKRFIDLYIRSTRFGRPLNRNEEEEFGLITKSFTTADSRFYHSIAEQQIRVTTAHDVSCDACKGHIGGTRVTCLTCRLEGTFDSVDFCDSPSCISAKVIPTGLTRLHMPTHDILKLRRVVHIRQFGKTYRQAQQALKTAREFFPNSENEEEIVPHLKATTRESPRCAVCSLAVTQPCWFCVQCEEPTFICIACEAKKKLLLPGHTVDSHDLVRCQVQAESMEVTMEERLADLERRFRRHEAHMDDKLLGLESNINDRLSKVDNRLSEVEKLLQRLVSALASPSR